MGPPKGCFASVNGIAYQCTHWIDVKSLIGKKEGDLWNCIDNKTVKRYGLEPIKRVFAYVLFSVRYFL